MTRKQSIVTGAIVLLATTLIPVDSGHASVLFSQARDVTREGAFSNSGAGVAAEDFVLPSDATITDVHWYGNYGLTLDPMDTAVDFQIRFYSDASGLPGTLLYDRVVAAAVANTGMVVPDGARAGNPVYAFTADPIDPFAVTGGDTLWIAISEDDDATEGVGPGQWLWSFSADLPGGSARAGELSGTDWFASNSDHAFSLTGESEGSPVVPEPATMLLFGSGVLGVFVKKRRP